MQKLILVPDSASYQSTDGAVSIRTSAEGGPARYRQDKLGATKMVTCQWTLNPAQYQYWRAFYNTATGQASTPFLCDMMSEDGSGPVEHTCYFIPGSVVLPNQQGLTYVQSAQLEVIPLPVDDDLNNSIIAIFDASGGNPESWMSALDHLVTVTMPGHIGG